MPRAPFDAVSDLIERHVSAEESAPAAISIISALAVLAGDATHTPAPAARAAARRRLTEATTWFDGTPAKVAALIDDIAFLEPRYRDRRKAVLTAAWADLLAE